MLRKFHSIKIYYRNQNRKRFLNIKKNDFNHLNKKIFQIYRLETFKFIGCSFEKII